jgi:hypothetical protein
MCGCTALISSSDVCSPSRVGYSPTQVIRSLDSSTTFSDSATDSTRIMTRIMILHPIATGLSFIGAVLGAFSGRLGSFVASMIALLSFFVALVALVCDFVLFSILKRNINDSPSDMTASYSVGIWTLLAGTVCTLLASIILFFTCCFGRSRSRKPNTV